MAGAVLDRPVESPTTSAGGPGLWSRVMTWLGQRIVAIFGLLVLVYLFLPVMLVVAMRPRACRAWANSGGTGVAVRGSVLRFAALTATYG